MKRMNKFVDLLRRIRRGVLGAGWLHGRDDRDADLRPPYRAVLPDFCERLPFEVFTEQLGRPRFRFGVDEPFGSLESFGIVDTMFFSCEVFTTSTEPERRIWDLVVVTIETDVTSEQARAVFDAQQPDADAEPVQFGELTGAVDRWRAFQHPLPLSQHGQYTRTLRMVDRNVVASVSFHFIPGRVDEQRFASATVDFVTAMWTELRGNTRTTPTTSIAAPPTPAYAGQLTHGFSPRWDITALEAVLGPRLAVAFPDFRSLDASMVGCRLRTAGPSDGDSRHPGATITLHIKYFDSAEQATAFFAVHFTVAAVPLPPLGALADVTAMSWQYRPPSDDHDGKYVIAAADNNTIVLLQVASYVGNTVIDDQLARPITDILNTALQLIRARGGEEGVRRVSGPAAAEESRPFLAAAEAWSDHALDGVDWHRVSHAFGSALDTPEQLRGLTAADVARRGPALSHLWNSVTHQESLTTATAPVAELVARMLADYRLAEPAPAGEDRSMRASLLSYLGHVAAWAAYLQAKPNTVDYVRRDDPEVGVFDVVWEPENDTEYVVVGRLGAGCARRAGVVIPLLVPWLDAPDPQERATALYALSCWVGLAGTTVPVPRRALERLTAVATDSTVEMDCRIDCVLGLAAIGADTSDLLDDASMVIRACAALSPAMVADPRALPVITGALTSPGSGDDWLRRRPPVPYAEATFSARLVEAALRCTDDFELLLPAAVAVAAAARPWTIDETWGPLLAAAFPAPAADHPLSTAQRAYLFALAANDTIWRDRQDNRDELLHGLGLPLDRDALRSLATAR